MSRKYDRRTVLGLTAGAVGGVAGCASGDFPTRTTTSTDGGGLWGGDSGSTQQPSECEQGVAFWARLEKLHVEPEQTFDRDNDGDLGANADPDKVPEIQRRVGPAGRVRVIDEFGDENDFGFYGLVPERTAKTACRNAGVDIRRAAWKGVFDDEALPHLKRRLSIFREVGVDLPSVEAKEVQHNYFLIYSPDVPYEEMFRLNRMIRPMGHLVVSVGDPASGRFRPVPVPTEEVTLDGTAVSLPLRGDQFSSLLADFGVAAEPDRWPLHVFVDGTRAASLRLDEGDVTGGKRPELVSPRATLSFGDLDTAVSAYAALRDPALTFVKLSSLCEHGPTPTQVPWY